MGLRRGGAAPPPGAHQRPPAQFVCISPINGISCPLPRPPRPAPRAAWPPGRSDKRHPAGAPRVWGRVCPRVGACGGSPRAGRGSPVPAGAAGHPGPVQAEFHARFGWRGAEGRDGERKEDPNFCLLEPFSALVSAPPGLESGLNGRLLSGTPSYDTRPNRFPSSFLQPPDIADQMGELEKECGPRHGSGRVTEGHLPPALHCVWRTRPRSSPSGWD